MAVTSGKRTLSVQQTPVLIQEVTLLPSLRPRGLWGHTAGFCLNPVLRHEGVLLYFISAFLPRARLGPGRPAGRPQTCSLMPEPGGAKVCGSCLTMAGAHERAGAGAQDPLHTLLPGTALTEYPPAE